MEVKVYIPNSIELPSNSKIERIFPESRQVYASDDTRSYVGEFDVLGSPALYNQRIKNLDKKTIFFDIFVDSDYKLKGLGPRPYNLKDQLLRSMKVYVNGKELNFQLYEIDEILYFRSKRELTHETHEIYVKFVFNSFEVTIEPTQVKVQTENAITKSVSTNYGSRKLTVSTLQKDNDIQWIYDWILWHERLHRVDRVVIYDNGSRNWVRLKEKLQNLNSNVLCVMVEWQFPFGVYPFTSTRQGYLNHCRLRFPVDDGYCVNLDIDEYLASPSATSFWAYLEKKNYNALSSIFNLKECKLPNVREPDECVRSVPRIFDFQYRFKRYGHHPTQESTKPYAKYVYKFNSPIHATTHTARFSFRECLALKQTPRIKLGYIFWFAIHKAHKGWRRFKVKQQKLAVNQNHVKYMHVDIDESNFHFFHVMGLTRNFKRLTIKKSTEFDSSLHVHEPLIAKLSTLAKLDQDISQHND